ncbi:dentin sialophosphoprotein-like [Apis laboriosa]|uniref:dentin sialophosphoprotein-like n=1 Tax=Apis laboriosa TaxID=183418 RepID=UPI001CC63EBA|nr:dentin sialophosphoprotein-like [Apis laboriosa]
MLRESVEEIAGKPDGKNRIHTETISVDSPLRRSSRIKQNLKQNEFSPESSLSDANNTQTSRSPRRRLITMDNTVSIENQRNLRSRTNSVSSDISEVLDTGIGTPTRKTKNNDNKMIGNRRSKRLVRAGSEANSPPSATRNTRNTRASSMGPEATSDKLTEKRSNELISTSIRTRRRSSLIFSEVTTEEKGISMKIPRVTLNRTLPDINESTQSDSKNSLKPIEEDDSLLFSKNKCDTSHNSICEKYLDNDVKITQHNDPENSSSNKIEDVEKNLIMDNKKIADNSKSAELENNKTLSPDITIKEKSNKSQILSQNENQNISMKSELENLNDTLEKYEDHNNKKILTTNIIIDLQNMNNTQQNPRSSLISNNSNEDKCKSPCVKINLTPKHCSKKLSDVSNDNDNVSLKKVENITDSINDLSVKSMGISINQESNSDNMQKLITSPETEPGNGNPYNENSDKNLSIHINDNKKDINIANDNESIEINSKLNKKSEEIDNMNIKMDISCEKESMNEDDFEKDSTNQCKITNDQCEIELNIKMDISSEKENMSENDSEKNNTNQYKNTSDQYKIKNRNNESNTSDIIYENDEINCTKEILSPKLSNRELSNSIDMKLIDIHNFDKSKHEDTNYLQKINEMNNSSSDLSKSCNTDMSSEDLIVTNIKEDNVTNLNKNNYPVTESTDLVQVASEKQEYLEKDSVLDNSTDSLMLKKQLQTNELQSKEKYPDINKPISKEYQEKIQIGDNNSDTNMTNLFQDIPATEWKEKNNEYDKNSEHLSTEKLENQMESDYDLILVDKEAYSSAEKLKKEKEIFDYDSDDTIILKIQRDSMKTENDTEISMDILENKCKLNDSKNKSSTSNKRKSIKNKNKEKKEVKSDIEDAEEDVKLQNMEISDGKSSRDKTRKKLKKNYSTTANILSDSEKSKDISDSDDTQKKFMNIPKFLFAETSDSENNDSESNNSIDSDIQKEYNFHGKNISKFSDDDIPGDECRASETESSDPDDNGSDMADFIVDDDEVEEEEESESEEKENEEIENEKKKNEESENEEKENEEENEEIEIEEKQDKEKEEEKDEEIENNVELDIEENVKKSKKKGKDKKRDQNIEKSLNGSQIIFNKKIKDLDVKMDNSNIKENVNESMVYSTPKINLSNKDKFNIKTYDVQKNLSLDEEKSKDITLKKKLKKLKSDESLAHRSLPSELIEFVAETNLSRPMSSKVLGLNKTTLVLGSDTPTTRYLKKDKLNESAPILKSDIMFKELTNTINSSKKNDQIEKENEDDNEKNKKISKEVDDSLKKKLFNVANNILENDRRKKRKKQKQSTIQETIDPILLESDFQLNKNADMLKRTKEIVPFINTNDDNDNEIRKVNKIKKKKKKMYENNVQMEHQIFENILETKPDSLDKNIHNEVKKKKKKEKIIEDVSNLINTNEKTNIVKKKKKASDVFSICDDMSNEQSRKKKKKKETCNIDVQIKEKIFENIRSENYDEKIYNEIKKKKTNITKKKKKVLDILLNNNISNEQLSKKNKKKKAYDTDVQLKQIFGNTIETKAECLDEKIHSEEKEKRKKKRENTNENVLNPSNTNKNTKIVKKKKIADILPNNTLNEQLSKKKKKQKTYDIDIQMRKPILENVIETISKSHDEKIYNKLKKKKKIESAIHDISNITDIKGMTKIKQKKFSDILNNVSNEQLIKGKKRKQKLLKDITSQDKEEILEKIPQKKQRLLENALTYNMIQKRKYLETHESNANKKRKILVEQDFSLPSNSGSTTHFDVVDIQKIKKKKKVSFRNKILGRNFR